MREGFEERLCDREEAAKGGRGHGGEKGERVSIEDAKFSVLLAKRGEGWRRRGEESVGVERIPLEVNGSSKSNFILRCQLCPLINQRF